MADEEKEDEGTSEKKAPPSVGKHLFESRQITVFGAVDGKLAERVVAQLLALEADDPEKPITMILNSPGGSVSDGFAIYDAMRFIRPEVRVVCTGLAASIATVVLLGAPKEQRLAMPSCKLLIHQVYIPGVVRGQATDLEITARELVQTRERINQLYVEETGQPLDRVERDTNRDYWMTAEEAVEYGLIARVVTSRAELD
ncbi:MAG: ATP-dependent Clp protease proteolytic subunit [Alphaproteobacteria bacterium]|nr:ATP-dependent Clp protease proteolytic subunit [Alphaproteobacteria bacterium]